MIRFLRTTAAAMAVAAFTLAGAGLAQATTTNYELTVDSCSSGCGLSDYGTVAVTDDADPNVLHILVTLADNVYFNQAGGGLDAFFFDLVGNPTITISGLSSQFGTNGSQAAGSHHEDGLGDWDYIITWLGPPNDNSTLGVQTLSFDITGLSALTLDSTFSHDQDIFFGADIYSAGFTGLVGAPGGGGAVPEPATWALLIFGIGLTGVVLRRRRAGKAAFA